jgi:hypothetical protein
MSIIQWLHRYIFKGIGIAFLIGVLTSLYVMICQFRELAHKPPAPQAPIHGVKR